MPAIQPSSGLSEVNGLIFFPILFILEVEVGRGENYRTKVWGVWRCLEILGIFRQSIEMGISVEIFRAFFEIVMSRPKLLGSLNFFGTC